MPQSFMEDRLAVLEQIAALALEIRLLEHTLGLAGDPHSVMERLHEARENLDSELESLGALSGGTARE